MPDKIEEMLAEIEEALPRVNTGDAREIGYRLLACVKILREYAQVRPCGCTEQIVMCDRCSALARAEPALKGDPAPEEIPAQP